MGVTIVSNILDANLRGAVFLHQGGNNNVTNNIILNGDASQLEIGPVLDNFGHTIERNIVLWAQASSSILECSFMKYWDAAVISKMDHNLYWCMDPSVDVMHGSPNVSLFPGASGLLHWKETSGHDAHSIVADPLFVDP